MNIQVIAEHSVDVNLLPDGANILDAGCRGFEFANFFISIGTHNVYSIDADVLITDNIYTRIALMSKDGIFGLFHNNDPQATMVMDATSLNMVQGVSIDTLSKNIGIQLWDLIKLDIEGSEYEVIMSMDRPYATQISVEFHLHTGVYDMRAVDEMVSKLKSLGYDPVRHEMTSRHGMGMNYWDSLFILESALK